MLNRSILVLFIIFALCGCQHNTKNTLRTDGDYPLHMVSAKENSSPPHKVKTKKEIVEMKGQLKPLPLEIEEKAFDELDFSLKEADKDLKIYDSSVVQPLPLAVPSAADDNLLSNLNRKKIQEIARRALSYSATISNAKSNSRITPSSAPDGWINAITMYDYMEGALYQIYTSQGNITDVMLQPGENLISQSAGDTLRWKTGVTYSGTGKNKRYHIQIKPTHKKIKTNMIINTDRRVYYLELSSTGNKSYMASCSWQYPNDDFIERYNIVEKQNTVEKNKIIIPSLENLNFNYEVIGDQPWKPIRVFDDGRKTFIQFPPDMKYMAAPVLFVANQGTTQLVNYRKKGDYYIVDRLFMVAELRHGLENQAKIRIKNNKIIGNTEVLYSAQRYPGQNDETDFDEDPK